MAIRIGDYIFGGELYHRRQNSVCGWLDFGNGTGLKLELTGNLTRQLCNKSFRFEVTEAQPSENQVRQFPNNMEMIQIGAVGDVILRMAKIPDCSMEKFSRRLAASEPIEYLEQPCLYLEWFSQNGRVIAEIVNPKIEFLDDDDEVEASAVQPEPLSDAGDLSKKLGPQITGFTQNEHGFVEEFLLDVSADDGTSHDPYGLFAEDLEWQLSFSDGGDEGGDGIDSDAQTSADAQPRDWADVIPGIDPETKAMYEQWDEVLHGTDHDPVATLFDPPLSLPLADGLTEAEAWQHLNVVLARLATFSVAIDMCAHATALSTYRWLVEEILPEARFTSASTGSGFVQHYSTFDNCPQCDAEFEAT